MKREKDTAVRCVYIALRWSAVASARFSIDILLRWSKEILGGVWLFSRQRRDMSIDGFL